MIKWRDFQLYSEILIKTIVSLFLILFCSLQPNTCLHLFINPSIYLSIFTSIFYISFYSAKITQNNFGVPLLFDSFLVLEFCFFSWLVFCPYLIAKGCKKEMEPKTKLIKGYSKFKKERELLLNKKLEER